MRLWPGVLESGPLLTLMTNLVDSFEISLKRGVNHMGHFGWKLQSEGLIPVWRPWDLGDVCLDPLLITKDFDVAIDDLLI